MKRVRIEVKTYGSPDSEGRVSHDLTYINLEGRKRMQTFFARPADTVARLRHNMAENYWFHKRRLRWAREARR